VQPDAIQTSLFDSSVDEDDENCGEYPSWLDPKNWKTPRWKTAIKRQDLSLPVRNALSSNFLPTSGSWLDFGCGRGLDMPRLSDRTDGRYEVDSFDPYYYPKFQKLKKTYSILSLVYVLNVIEEPFERCKLLQLTWDLCTDAMVIAVRCDGVGQNLTRIGTFQKYYDRDEFLDLLIAYCPGSRIFGIGAGHAIACK
jgi:DNA phosphorothioation-associated putative methyltransferase